MYAGRVACCPVMNHGEYADGTDRRTDARPLHWAFRYRRGQRKNKYITDRQLGHYTIWSRHLKPASKHVLYRRCRQNTADKCIISTQSQWRHVDDRPLTLLPTSATTDDPEQPLKIAYWNDTRNNCIITGLLQPS